VVLEQKNLPVSSMERPEIQNLGVDLVRLGASERFHVYLSSVFLFTLKIKIVHEHKLARISEHLFLGVLIYAKAGLGCRWKLPDNLCQFVVSPLLLLHCVLKNCAVSL